MHQGTPETICEGYPVWVHGWKERIVASRGFGYASSAASLRYSKVCKLTK